ncbi:MAG TPA: DUF2092 domain-containing protein [Thermomonas sp.]|nr:DUF2092 domain-containing protein [Thermomonas sp.]
MSPSIPIRRWLHVAAGCIVLAAAGVAPAAAQDATDAETAGDNTALLDTSAVVTPEAQEVLDRMTATLKSMRQYSVTASITRDEVLAFGYKLQNTESARMWVDAPKHLRMEVAGDIKNRTYVYDGAQLTMFAPDLNVYAETSAPGTIGELVGMLLDAGVEMPLIDLLYHGNTGSLTEDVRVGLVAGESEVDGVATDHLAFRQPQVDWQLWVEKGKQALPRKLLITTRYQVGDPQYQATLRWDLKPTFNAKSFVFAPPAGATKIPYNNPLAADGGDK